MGTKTKAMNVVNKKNQNRFREGIMAFLKKINAQPQKHTLGYDNAINTIYGKLNIKEPRKYDKGVPCVSVCCRFSEPDKAKEDTRCNQFTGKWNFHFTQENIDKGIKLFEREIMEIIIN